MPFNRLESEIERRGVVKFARIPMKPCEKLAKRGKETPNRMDASPDLFGVSRVQVIHLNHPLDKANIEGGWKGPRGKTPSLRGFVKSAAR